MNRPLMRLSIGELEELFDVSADNAKALKRLEHELKFRQVPRAIALLEKVQSAAGKLAFAAIPTLGSPPLSGRSNPRPHRLHPSLFSEAPAQLRHKEKDKGEQDVPPPAAVPTPEVRDSEIEAPRVAIQAAQTPIAATEMSVGDAYRVLNLSPGSSWEAVEQARRKMVQQAHPEGLVTLNTERKAQVQESARRANLAHAVLLRDLLTR